MAEERIIVHMMTTAAWPGGTAAADTNVLLPASIARDFIGAGAARAVVDPAVLRRLRDEIEDAEGAAQSETPEGVMTSGQAKKAVVSKPQTLKEKAAEVKKAAATSKNQVDLEAEADPDAAVTGVVTSKTLEAVAEIEPGDAPPDEISDEDLAQDPQ